MKKTISIEQHIKKMKKMNGGKQPMMIGSDGFQIEFTPENYKKAKYKLEQELNRRLQTKDAA